MKEFFSDTIGIEFTEFGIYHFIPLVIIILGVFLIYLFRDKLKEYKHEKRVRYTLGILGIVSEISLHLWIFLNGNWTAKENLPIGLCAFSLFLGIYIMFTKSYKVFEIAYFWAVGGVISILFPDILFGPDRFRYYQYVFGHSIFFFMFMYMMFVHSYIPTFKSYKKSFVLLLGLVLLVIIPINQIFESNFMYLREPGDTPFEVFYGNGIVLYVTGCIILAMVVMTLWYLPVAIYNKRKAK